CSGCLWPTRTPNLGVAAVSVASCCADLREASNIAGATDERQGKGRMKDVSAAGLPAHVNRRGFLREAVNLTLTVVGSCFLASCSSPRTSAPGPAAEGDLGGVLNFLGYDGEEGANVAKPFLESNGIKMQATFQSSADEALTKFQTGGRGSMDIIASN